MKNELLDRYIYHIGQELPKNRREDIETEIRSLLEETLENRAGESGRPLDDDLVSEVLREFGSPEKVAEGYREPRCLIGPRFYPLFIMVIKIVAAVLGALALVHLGINLGTQVASLANLPQALLNAFLEFAGAFLTALANIVIVFAILERTLPKSDKDEEAWDPRKLEKIPETGKVNPFWTIVGIIATFIVILLFNFYPEVIGVYTRSEGFWTMEPIFTALFFTYVPFLTVLWVADIVKNLLLLRSRMKSTTIRWVEVAIDAASLALWSIILTGGEILRPAAIFPAEILSQPELNLLFGQMATWVIIIILITTGVDLVGNLYHLLIKQRKAGLTVAQ